MRFPHPPTEIYDPLIFYRATNHSPMTSRSSQSHPFMFLTARPYHKWEQRPIDAPGWSAYIIYIPLTRRLAPSLFSIWAWAALGLRISWIFKVLHGFSYKSCQTGPEFHAFSLFWLDFDIKLIQIIVYNYLILYDYWYFLIIEYCTLSDIIHVFDIVYYNY